MGRGAYPWNWAGLVSAGISVLLCPKITAAFGDFLAWQRKLLKVLFANQEIGVPRPWPIGVHLPFFVPLGDLRDLVVKQVVPHIAMPIKFGRGSAAIGDMLSISRADPNQVEALAAENVFLEVPLINIRDIDITWCEGAYKVKIIRVLLIIYFSGNTIWALLNFVAGTTDEKMVAGGYFIIGSIGLCACLIGCKRSDDTSFKIAHAMSGLFVFVATFNGITLQTYFPVKWVLSTEMTGMQGVEKIGMDLIVIVLMIVESVPYIKEQYEFRKEAKKYDHLVKKFEK